MQMQTLIRAALLVGLAVAAPAAAKDTLGVFGDWAAFRQRGACYATTASTSAAQGRKAPAYLTVTVWVRGRPAEVMYGLGTAARSARLSVGGQGFVPQVRGDAAWMPEPRGDALLVQAMLAGSRAGGQFISGRGNRLTDQFSLAGFADALRAVQVACR